jgi:metal-responsive CopG/Arc/MetJ family transcriptional regulator
LPPKIAEAVDRWAGKQDDKPRRSEAIRRLVEIGLQKEARFKPFPKDHSI